MDTTTERVAVSLPKTVIDRIERVRQRLNLNRSKFFLFAMVQYLDNIIEDEDKRLQKAYKAIEDTDKEILENFKSSYSNLPVYESD